MFEYLMLGDIRAQKYLKTGARTCSILKKFAFNTTLLKYDSFKKDNQKKNAYADRNVD